MASDRKTALHLATECYFRHSTNVRRHGDRSALTTKSLVLLSYSGSDALARNVLRLLKDILHGRAGAGDVDMRETGA